MSATQESVTKAIEDEVGHVHFSPAVTFREMKPQFSRSKVLRAFYNDQYDEFSNHLVTYKLEIIEVFRVKGDVMLNHAILSSNLRSLELVYNNMPRELIARHLQSEEFSILNSFLGGQHQRELDNRCDPEYRRFRQEKLKLLCRMHLETVETFVKNNSSDPRMTSAISKDFQLAIEEVKNKLVYKT